MENSPNASPSKHLSITMPDYSGANNLISPRQHESRTLTSKMKKILASPKVMRGKSIPSPNKTFGMPLEFLSDRDGCEVPLIVTRICEYLKKNGIHQEGLFRVNGNMKVVERLKVAFDKCGDAELEEIGDVPAAASLLKMFLRELSEPVVNEDCQYLFINIHENFSKEKPKSIMMMHELVKQMPKRNICLLKYLCRFMLDIAKGSEKNKMTPLALAIVFGPNLFRCGDGLDGLKDQAFVNAILLDMLQYYDKIFVLDEDERRQTIKAPEKPIPYIEHMRNKFENEKKEKPERPPPPKVKLIDDKKLNSHEHQDTEKEDKVDNTESHLKKKRDLNIRKKNQLPGTSNRVQGYSSPPLTPHYSSPLSKQVVDTTIHSAVKEHLFGPGLTISSTESDIQDDTLALVDEVGEVNEINHVYPSVKDRIKRLNESNHTSPKKIQRQKKPYISVEDFNFVKENSSGVLSTLTHDRPQPPKSRRRPSFRSSKTEDSEPAIIDEPAIKSHVFNNRDNGTKDYFESPKGTSEKLSTNLESNSRKASVGQKNENAPAEIGSSIPPLDINRLQDDEGEARRSPRGRYHQFDVDEPLRSPHSASSSPDLNEHSRFKRNEVWNEKRQDTVPIVEMSPQDLRKRILALKKIISNFENDFETKNGRKPKPSDKTRIQKYIAELGRAKKQYRELLTDYNENADFLADTAPIGTDFGTAPNLREVRDTSEEKSKEKTLHTLLKRLEEKRLQCGRPQEIQVMNIEQLKEEKLAVQKALLQYENLHGRPTTKDDKTLMRPIYDRYRKIKRLIATGKFETKETENDIRTDIENFHPIDTINLQRERSYTRERLTEAGQNEKNKRLSLSPDSDKNSKNRYNNTILSNGINRSQNEDHFSSTLNELEDDTFAITKRLQNTRADAISPPIDSPRSIDEAILHNATISELLEQQRNTKRAKKRLGKLLKDFEEEFYTTWNRKVQKDDRLPKESEYREYKLIKSKLRLVEALIAKKAANQTV